MKFHAEMNFIIIYPWSSFEMTNNWTWFFTLTNTFVLDLIWMALGKTRDLGKTSSNVVWFLPARLPTSLFLMLIWSPYNLCAHDVTTILPELFLYISATACFVFCIYFFSQLMHGNCSCTWLCLTLFESVNFWAHIGSYFCLRLMLFYFLPRKKRIFYLLIF